MSCGVGPRWSGTQGEEDYGIVSVQEHKRGLYSLPIIIVNSLKPYHKDTLYGIV